MNASIMNESVMNASILDFGTTDVDKIRNYIEILEEHQNKCEKSAKFIEAELAKQRVIQLKKIEKEKVILEKKNEQDEETKKLEFCQREELQRFNEKSDEDFYELNHKFTDMEKNLREQQEAEIISFIENFNETYPHVSKPSVEILNLNKMLENLIKQKEYANCHLVQIQIAELTKTENKKLLEEKERKLKIEIDNIKAKQELETQAFQLKMSSAYNEFKSARATEFDRIIQKYKNRAKDLEKQQKIEINTIAKMKSGDLTKSTNLFNSKFTGKENNKMNQSLNRTRFSSASKKN